MLSMQQAYLDSEINSALARSIHIVFAYVVAFTPTPLRVLCLSLMRTHGLSRPLVRVSQSAIVISAFLQSQQRV
ncbi:hypothetical protein WN944_005998 [Citrus x changshan-huyou]|uniref:Uncharacterized protein n=1 Tax=Citrus x changshan-huyou TaxID=2935761 RepID=A0AAP0MKZ8_9ROSI